MVRKSVLLPLLAAAAVLVAVGFADLVVPLAFEVPCPEPEEGGGPGSSAAPSPGPASEAAAAAACVCLRVSRVAVRAVCFVAGVLIGIACTLCYKWLADADEEEAAAGAARKAGYVAIAGDLEVVVGTGAGGKN